MLNKDTPFGPVEEEDGDDADAADDDAMVIDGCTDLGTPSG